MTPLRVLVLLSACASSGDSNDGDADVPMPQERPWVTQLLGVGSSGRGVTASSDGSVTIVGSFSGQGRLGAIELAAAGQSDVFVAKLDADGQPVWAVSVGGTELDEGNAIASDGGGNSYIVGYCGGSASFGTTTFTCRGIADAFVAKLDPAGSFVWATRVGSDAIEVAMSVAVVREAVYVVGRFEGSAVFGDTTLTSKGDIDAFIARVDPSSGSFVWARAIGGVGADAADVVVADDAGMTITGMMQNTVTIDGRTITSAGQTDVFLARFTPDGQVTYLVRGGGAGSDYGTALTPNPAGGVYFAGGFQNAATFGEFNLSGQADEIVVASIDDAGVFAWATATAGGVRALATALATDHDGAALMVGAFNDETVFGSQTVTSKGSEDVFVTRISPEGQPSWTVTAGGASYDFAHGIAIGPGGAVSVIGTIGGDATFDETTLVGADDAFVWRMARPLIEVAHCVVVTNGSCG